MDINLKDCYNEAGLKGANVLIIDNRMSAINNILNEKYLNDDNSMILGMWLMGEEQENTETILEDIERFFCKEDESFCRDDENELRVLLEVLLLDYCENNKEKKIPLMILCGYSIGKRLLCYSIFKKFQALVDDARLEIRYCEDLKKTAYKHSGMQSLKNEITEAKDKQAVFEYSTDQLNNLIKVIEIQDTNMKQLQKDNELLKKKVICQREESDVLWWMNGKWSLLYKKSFKDMDAEELAIAIPMELMNFSAFTILPYSVEQIIIAVIYENASKSDRIPLLNYAEKINDAVMAKINDVTRLDSITSIQPILGLIKSIKEYGTEKELLKGLMFRGYNINIEDIALTPIEFAKHFCLEMELADNF